MSCLFDYSRERYGGLMSTEGTTQGDPLIVAMYTLAVTPLIHHLRSSDPTISQICYANDATGVGKCAALRKWWDTFPANASKMYLVVKDKYVCCSCQAYLFRHRCCYFSDGQRHLGAAISHRDYTATYVTSKVAVRLNAWQRLQTFFHMLPMQLLLMGCLVAGITLCALSQTSQIYCSPWRMLFINLLFQHCLVVLLVHLPRETCMHSQSTWVIWV